MQKLKEKSKKNDNLSYGAHASTVLSVLHVHLFGVSSLFCHTQRTLCPKPRVYFI